MSNDRDLSLLRTMLLIRMAEEKLVRHYGENEMMTPVHLSVGQEGVSAALCEALGKDDQLLGTYRSHGLYLARTGDARGFFAELYGRASSAAKGKAGSMHLASPDHGFMGTSAVVGTTIPVALGCALANKMQKNGRVVAVMFGDGAIDEGVFWESLNYAALAQLPIVLLCEDNGLAIHTSDEARHGYDSIAAIAERFRVSVARSDSTDAAELGDLFKKTVEGVRTSGRPAFLHVRCYRYLEHVGVNEDFDQGYRARAVYEEWRKRDPIDLVGRRLAGNGVPEKTIEEMRRSIARDLDAAVDAAKKAPFPKPGELYEDVYA